jgi:hypothetical protein
MRAGPLSNDNVISLLNAHYVPVFISNEDYDKKGQASAEEKKEWQRIYLEFANRKLGTGSVHVYLLGPDGHALEGLGVVKATNEKGRLAALLEKWAKELKVPAGGPVVAPKCVSAPTRPAKDGDSLVLHLVSRGENTGPEGGSWREFPAENYLELSREQSRKLLPPEGVQVKAGAAWDVDKDAAATFLRYFYPQAEDTTDAPLTTIERQSLKAKVLDVKDGVARARLEGDLAMKRPFYPGRPDPGTVEASILGFMSWDTKSGRVTSFEMVTDKAMYQKKPFGVAVNLRMKAEG